ncbi:Set1/Ash2 histone methyltransferase complex subunit ASH2 [Dictyocoela muelleri]|nr:Set1/Ash2 histone methyltransferase complex subunit ASH2 [Dictyocoela muelleri]
MSLRSIHMQKFALSKKFRHPSLKIDGLTLTGLCGYRSALADHGIKNGSYYFEVTIKEPSVRVGIAQLQATLNGPIGYDRFGYSIGSGYKYHLYRNSYGDFIEKDDTIGVLLYIDDTKTVYRHIDYEFFNYNYQKLDYYYDHQKNESNSKNFTTHEKKLNVNQNNKESKNHSFVKFFKNGVDMGIAYENVEPGVYFPAISLYNGASAEFNFGPFYIYPNGYEYFMQNMSNLGNNF